MRIKRSEEEGKDDSNEGMAVLNMKIGKNANT